MSALRPWRLVRLFWLRNINKYSPFLSIHLIFYLLVFSLLSYLFIGINNGIFSNSKKNRLIKIKFLKWIRINKNYCSHSSSSSSSSISPTMFRFFSFLSITFNSISFVSSWFLCFWFLLIKERIKIILGLWI